MEYDFNSTSCVFCIPLVRASWDRKHHMSWIKITYIITNFERFYLSHGLILFLCINPYFRGSLIRKIPTSFKILVIWCKNPLWCHQHNIKNLWHILGNIHHIFCWTSVNNGKRRYLLILGIVMTKKMIGQNLLQA